MESITKSGSDQLERKGCENNHKFWFGILLLTICSMINSRFVFVRFFQLCSVFIHFLFRSVHVYSVLVHFCSVHVNFAQFLSIFVQICSCWLSFAQFLFIFVQFMSIFIKFCSFVLSLCSFLLSSCQFCSVRVYFCSVINYLCPIKFQIYVTKLMHISNSSEQFNAFPQFFCNTITPINKQFFSGLLHQHQNIYIVPPTARRQEKRGNNSFCREWICFNIFFSCYIRTLKIILFMPQLLPI